MTSDLDIYRTASVLIREHGEDAALEAAQHADPSEPVAQPAFAPVILQAAAPAP
jgi:hypothetical protein